MSRKAASVLGLAAAAVGYLGWYDVPMAWGQTRAKGLDASFDEVNFQTAANAGYQFGWVESTNGNITRAAYTHNITTAPSATFTYNGMTQHFLIGTYHYVNPDINSAATEVGYFLSAARNYQKPGYLLPIDDLETGTASTLAVSSYSGAYSDALYAQLGFYPIFYSDENHTQYISASAAAKTAGLWIGRPSFTDAQAQVGDPDHPGSIPEPYGGFGSYASQPWTAWQYGGTTVGGANIDKDVAHGDLEFVKDLLIPAVRVQGPGGVTSDWSGSWRNISGDPTAAMNVWLDTTGVLNTITLSAGANVTVRMLGVDRDNFTMNGGSFTATRSVTFDGAATVGAGAALTSPSVTVGTRLLPTVTLDASGAPTTAASTTGSLTVGAGGTVNAGVLTVGSGVTVTVTADAVTPGKVVVNGGGIAFDGTGAGATIKSAGAGTAGSIDLAGGVRTVDVSNGTGAVDLTLGLPLANGGITKTGAGTLSLTANNTFTQVNLNGGVTRVTAKGQLGGAPVVSNTTVITAGSAGSGSSGTLQLRGGGTYTNPLAITGAGALGLSTAVNNANPGALDNAVGNNTWAGPITLAGAGSAGTDPTENQISAASGTALTITGAITDGPGVHAAWVKNGAGDVVLSGTATNTYGGLTRPFNGRLILEKDAALGVGGGTTVDQSTVFLAGTATTVAFRAPSGSSGFTYATDEWIFTNGTGAGGLGQVDNLGGNNTFAGSIGIGGAVSGGVVQGSIGVSAGSLTITGGIYATGTSPRNIVKTGAGTLTLQGNSAGNPTNTFATSLSPSTMTISGGAVVMNGTAAGTANVPGITSFVVNAGTSLSVGRVGAIGNAGVTLNGGGMVRTTGVGAHSLGAVTLGSGGGVVDTAGNSATFNGALTGTSSLTKAGLGAATFNNMAGFNGPLTASAGTLGVGGSGKLLQVTGLTVAGNPNGSIEAWDGGTRMNFVATASLDLNGNDAIWNYTGASTADLVRQLITTGARGADGADAALTWGGPGITSSAARGVALAGTAAPRELGYAEASTYVTRVGSKFDSVTLDGTAVLVKYTFAGDANLDGVVDDRDVDLVVASFQDSRKAASYPEFFTNRVWGDGDFNYDGVVDGADVDLIAATFGGTETGLAITAAGDAKLVALVPEPVGTGVLVVMGVGMLGRRRRARRMV